MGTGSISRQVSAILGLSGFAVAIVSGVAAGNGASRTVSVALVAMVACMVVGGVIGTVLQRVVGEHVSAYARAHPPPSDDVTGVGDHSSGTSGAQDASSIVGVAIS